MTIRGTDFSIGSQVNIGGAYARGVNCIRITSVTAVTPQHALGSVAWKWLMQMARWPFCRAVSIMSKSNARGRVDTFSVSRAVASVVNLRTHGQFQLRIDHGCGS